MKEGEMSTETQETGGPVRVTTTRRTVLRAALVVGAASIGISAPGSRASAATPGARGPEVSLDVPAGLGAVLSEDGTNTSMPIGLGVSLRVRGTTSVPAGAILRLRWDARLYRANDAAFLRDAAGSVLTTMPLHGVSTSAGSAESELVVPVALHPGRTYDLVAGYLNVPRYPDDLIDAPVPTAAIFDLGNGHMVQSTLATSSRGSAPWGATLGAIWQQPTVAWACPSVITVASTGPGPIPRRSEVRLDIAANAASAVAVAGAADADGAPVDGVARVHREAGRTVLSWSPRAPIAAGQHVNLTVSSAENPAYTANADHGPTLLQFIAASRDSRSQRTTGQESAIAPAGRLSGLW
jgi:hypothetical protein